MEKYAKTVSPFRVEIFETHGGRVEYDQEKYESGQGENVEFMAKCRLLKWENPDDMD